MPWVGSEAMSLHLDAVSRAVMPSAHAVLVCDGAGWHQTGSKLRGAGQHHPAGRCPATRRSSTRSKTSGPTCEGNFLNRRVWNSYDEIVDACCTAWNAFINDKSRTKSITERLWASVTA